QAAMARNAEVDRLGNAIGVDPRNYSREDFFRLASEHMSLEEQARTIGSLDTASEQAFDDAENRARQWTEARGDTWEPDAVYAGTEPRTLEDLERGYQSEAAAATTPRTGEGGAGNAGPAPADTGPVQTGIRRGGRGAGATGRAGGGAGEI